MIRVLALGIVLIALVALSWPQYGDASTVPTCISDAPSLRPCP